MSIGTNRRRALVLLAAAGAATAGAKTLRPSAYLADSLGPIELDKSIPVSFGNWELDKQSISPLINPEQENALSKLYSDLLSQTYLHRKTGYRIMLSIAYGTNQSDSLSLHYPDVCYPSQGFSIKSRERQVLSTNFGTIPTVRLSTTMGDRHEPLTYWVTIGKATTESKANRKLTQLRYSLQGIIPDGLLFRVSSIDKDDERAFATQNQFISEVLLAIRPEKRIRLAGI